jgi:RimJ/RimL family protein N-acetyltransferase
VCELNLRYPHESDAEIIFSWRNSSEVRQVSLNSNEISYATHLDWFSTRLTKCKSEPFWIIEFQDRPAGFVRFDSRTKLEFEMSILLAPEVRGKGLGRIAMVESMNRFQNDFTGAKVIANVLKNNYISRKFFRSCNFLEVESTGDFVIFESIIGDNGSHQV